MTINPLFTVIEIEQFREQPVSPWGVRGMGRGDEADHFADTEAQGQREAQGE